MPIDKKQPKRKRIRLKNFEYNNVGAYFVTICTEGRKCILSEVKHEECIDGQENHTSANGCAIVGARIARPNDPILTEIGTIVDHAIQNIPDIYPAVSIEEYVIMPNHIHMLLRICADKYGRPMAAPTISRIVNQLKGYVSKQVGHPMWQKLYYDHIIRNKKDFERHVKYIYENPLNWFYDELYSE